MTAKKSGSSTWTGPPTPGAGSRCGGTRCWPSNYANILVGADNTNVYELEEGGAYKSVRRGDAGPVRSGAAVTTDGTVVWASGDPALLGGLAQGGNKWQVGADGQLSTPAVGRGQHHLRLLRGG